MCKPVQKAAPSIVNEDGHTVAGISLHIPVYRNRYTASKTSFINILCIRVTLKIKDQEFIKPHRVQYIPHHLYLG